MYIVRVKLVGRDKLTDFAKKHPQARGPIKAWVAEVEAAVWTTMANIKARFPHASILADNHVVFNLGGNKYRLETIMVFASGVVVVLRIGTHAEYDRWETRKQKKGRR